MTIYGYARVSTLGQDLSEQTQKLLKKGAEKVFSDKFSGKTAERPSLNELRKSAKKNDRVLITKLDRLARNAKDGLDIIDDFNKKGIAVEVLEQGLSFTGEDNAIQLLMRNMLLAFAEFERNQIVERTQSGKDFQRANNPDYTEGRPKRKINERYRFANELMRSMTVKEVAKKTGISERTLYYIKKQIAEENHSME